MAFHAKSQKSLLVLFLLILGTNIVLNVITQSFGYLFYVNVLIVLYLITVFFITYTFTIQDGHLTFETFLMTICIYERVIPPSQIKKVELKRYNWAMRGALIHTRKGLNLRLVLFSSNEIFHELLTFAHKHDIPTFKTKDYQLLERRSKYISKENVL